MFPPPLKIGESQKVDKQPGIGRRHRLLQTNDLHVLQKEAEGIKSSLGIFTHKVALSPSTDAKPFFLRTCKRVTILRRGLTEKMRLSHILLVALSLSPSAVYGFTPKSKVVRQTTRLFNADQEKLLRQEIINRNAQVDAEGKYAIADGENFSNLDEQLVKPIEGMNVLADMETTDSAAVVKDKTSLAAKMERMTKPRAFPLFIAEKAVEIVEDSVAGIAKMFQSSSSSETTGPKTKEKIVVLGSGWGAVSFIKGIDTDMYDITVISPRNHFTFTPMLVRLFACACLFALSMYICIMKLTLAHF